MSSATGWGGRRTSRVPFGPQTRAVQSSLGRCMTVSDPILQDDPRAATTRAFSRAKEALDSTVYARVARACLPRWLHLLGPSPWLISERAVRGVARAGAVQVYRRQAAALGVGLLTLRGEHEAQADFLHACVRATLGRWQMLLRSDGVPARKAWRRDPLQAAATVNVVLLLSEAPTFQTEEMLTDLGAHLSWLAGTRPQTCWIEAGTVLALAEGALLVRDSRLLDHARIRLTKLLARQSREGWFPERGGADLGRLSLTFDSLARLYLHHNWQELATPLRRAVDFMLNFVDPGGSVGGCYNSCGSAFLSPYGLELLASELPGAALLAQRCRCWCLEPQGDRLMHWHDHLVALLGAAHALAAVDATGAPLNVCPVPARAAGVRHFPEAGLAVFERPAYFAVVNARKGGAVEVTWRGSTARLSDGGVTVVTDGAVRTSGRQDTCRAPRLTESEVHCRGVLRWQRQSGRRRTSRLGVLIRRGASLVRRLFRTANSAGVTGRQLSHLPLGGQYERKISLAEHEVVIQDTVACRSRGVRVICQTVDQPGASKLCDPHSGRMSSHQGPLLVEAGRQVCITRTYRNGTLLPSRES